MPTLATTSLAAELLAAYESGVPIAPLTERHPDLTVADAYAIQRELLAGHAAAGRHVAGRKIGLTSLAIQQQIGVDSPDFGAVLDACTWPSAITLSRSGLRAILPRLEPELAFVLREELRGDAISAADVLAATESVMPVMELIDSRVRDWKIKLADTIADNASCLGAILGTPVALAQAGDLAAVRVAFGRDGAVDLEGVGSAVMGHPAEAVAWLARELTAHGDGLPAGQPILAGSFTAAIDATPGDYLADFGPLGSVTVQVTA